MRNFCAVHMNRVKYIKALAIFFSFLVSAVLLGGCNSHEQTKISNVTCEKDNEYKCTYLDYEREYIECVPDGGDIKGIIFMLPGYGDNASSFKNSTHMDDDANEEGYVVIYVTGLANPDDATSAIGWNSGMGNSEVDDIGFLCSLAKYMQNKYKTDRQHCAVVGFSNGGFMAHRVAVEGHEFFGAAVSVAGTMSEMIWESKTDNADISFLQINGSKDDVVPMKLNGSDKYAKSPAIEDVMEYYINANGLDFTEETELSAKATLTKYEGQADSNRVWQVLITDGRHSWPEEKIAGFDVNNLILEFIK